MCFITPCVTAGGSAMWSKPHPQSPPSRRVYNSWEETPTRVYQRHSDRAKTTRLAHQHAVSYIVHHRPAQGCVHARVYMQTIRLRRGNFGRNAVESASTTAFVALVRSSTTCTHFLHGHMCGTFSEAAARVFRAAARDARAARADAATEATAIEATEWRVVLRDVVDDARGADIVVHDHDLWLWCRRCDGHADWGDDGLGLDKGHRVYGSLPVAIGACDDHVGVILGGQRLSAVLCEQVGGMLCGSALSLLRVRCETRDRRGRRRTGEERSIDDRAWWCGEGARVGITRAWTTCLGTACVRTLVLFLGTVCAPTIQR